MARTAADVLARGLALISSGLAPCCACAAVAHSARTDAHKNDREKETGIEIPFAVEGFSDRRRAAADAESPSKLCNFFYIQ